MTVASATENLPLSKETGRYVPSTHTSTIPSLVDTLPRRLLRTSPLVQLSVGMKEMGEGEGERWRERERGGGGRE